MKRLVNIILVLVLFIQSFIWVIPVEALEGDPELQINGVKQGDKYLEQENDVYLVDGYDSIYLDYTVLNDNGERLFIRSIDAQGNGGYFEHYGNENSLIALNVGTDKENYNFTVQLCNDRNCNEIYDSKTINLKVTYFNEVKDSKIYFTNVKQGDTEIYLNEDNYLILNDALNISLTVKGENLIDDALYTVSINNYSEKLEFLGSKLEEGIELTINPDGLFSINIYVYLGTLFSTNKIGYVEDGKYYNQYQFNSEVYHQLPFEAKLVYTDYPKEVIAISSYGIIVLSSEYFNDEHSLSYYIKGEEYLDQDYDVTIEVKQEYDVIFSKNIKVNGLLLNEGINVELEDFILKLNTENYFFEGAYAYEFSIEIDGEKNTSYAKYNSIGKSAMLDMKIFFENNKMNQSAFMGDGSDYFEGTFYEVNREAFAQYSSIYFNIIGENFNDDEEYDYYLAYGNQPYEFNFFEMHDVVLSGKVKGDVLNEGIFVLEYGNPKNYDYPAYHFIVKKGEEIIYSNLAVLHLSETPTLANVALKTESKNLYLQNIDYEFSYVATRNAPLHIVISGLGFDEDKNYTFNIVRYKDNNDQVPYAVDTVIFTGKELNEGKAFVNYNEKIDDDVESYKFGIECEEVELARSSFYVTFVDSTDLFQDTKLYLVDNLKDLIKNIHKNTGVKDFISSLNIVNSGKVKIYDATGTKEIEGNVGTGMLARVMNEYEQSILDMDIVVTGDVTGDGNISITDLVKVKRHLAEAQELEGVYEIAGNVTETGEIGITDLVKISRDVAQIEEVE